MNLAIDIGNTLVKVGVFEDQRIVAKHAYTSFDRDQILGLLDDHEVMHVIISSVRDGDEVPQLPVSGMVVQLSSQTAVPVQSLYTTPETLGNDRLAAVVGAVAVYPDSNVLVIDAGTCITYDLVTEKRLHLGGNIAPGLEMRLDAMHQSTGRLPRVERGEADDFLGKSTTEALQHGALIGLLMEIAGYVEVMRHKHKGLIVTITGGDAQYLADRLKTEIFVRPDLVLTGLNEILKTNVAKFN